MSVSVVDYGLGNIGSVLNMFRRLGVNAKAISSPAEALDSDRLLLPGVGSFDNAMVKLASLGLDSAIKEYADTGRPLLGICLGMQLLLDGSEEGSLPGLSLIPGYSRRFAELSGLRVPHMGWNVVTPRSANDNLVVGLPDESRFYFVHSYRVVPESESDVLATTEYGLPFASMIRSNNVMGAQYHPEKSHSFGMQILRNFSEL